MLATMHHAGWMKRELKIARSGFAHPKPVLIVMPWGAKKRPQWSYGIGEGTEVVRWNTESIVAGIRSLA